MAINTSDYNHSSKPHSIGVPSEGMYQLASHATTDVPASPTEGQIYYDSTLKKFRGYTNAGWSQFGGTAASSLDAAYNGGASITVDAGAVTLTDTQTSTGGGLLITKSGVVTGADSASVFHINSTGAHDTSGALKMIEISVGSETVSGGIYGAEITMNANSDYALYATKGAVVLHDGALTLDSGAFTITSGAFTYTAGDMTMSDGSIAITDADNAASLSVTNNTITDANQLVSVASTSLTDGALMTLNANNAGHDG